METPIECPLNTINVDRYLQSITEHGYPQVSAIVKKVINHTHYVSFGELKGLLTTATHQFIDYLIDQQFIGITVGSHKSDCWIMKIVCQLVPKCFDHMIGCYDVYTISSLSAMTSTIRDICLFDDGLFSGIHMINILEILAEQLVDPQQYTIHIITGVCSFIAQYNIRTSTNFGEIKFYYGEEIFDLQSLLGSEEIKALIDFYQPQQGDNDLYNQFPVYFSHKMPGEFSGLPFIYRGTFPFQGTPIPLIKGCPSDLDIEYPPIPYRKK
jgi:hypothetical protein